MGEVGLDKLTGIKKKKTGRKKWGGNRKMNYPFLPRGRFLQAERRGIAVPGHPQMLYNLPEFRVLYFEGAQDCFMAIYGRNRCISRVMIASRGGGGGVGWVGLGGGGNLERKGTRSDPRHKTTPLEPVFV